MLIALVVVLIRALLRSIPLPDTGPVASVVAGPTPLMPIVPPVELMVLSAMATPAPSTEFFAAPTFGPVPWMLIAPVVVWLIAPLLIATPSPDEPPPEFCPVDPVP